jgi:hypothetical protein
VNRIHNHISAVALLLLLSGCGIGIAPWGDQQETFEEPYMKVLKKKGLIESISPITKDNIMDIIKIGDIKDAK